MAVAADPLGKIRWGFFQRVVTAAQPAVLEARNIDDGRLLQEIAGSEPKAIFAAPRGAAVFSPPVAGGPAGLIVLDASGNVIPPSSVPGGPVDVTLDKLTADSLFVLVKDAPAPTRELRYLFNAGMWLQPAYAAQPNNGVYVSMDVPPVVTILAADGSVLASRTLASGQQVLNVVGSVDDMAVAVQITTDGSTVSDVWAVDGAGHTQVGGVEPGWQVEVLGVQANPFRVQFDGKANGQSIFGVQWRPGFGDRMSPDGSWTVRFNRTRIGQTSLFEVVGGPRGLAIDPTANLSEPLFTSDGTRALAEEIFPAVETRNLIKATSDGAVMILFPGHGADPDLLCDFDDLAASDLTSGGVQLPKLVTMDPFSGMSLPLAATVSYDGAWRTPEVIASAKFYPSPAVVSANPDGSWALNMPPATGVSFSLEGTSIPPMADLRLTPVLHVGYRADATNVLGFQLLGANSQWLLRTGGQQAPSDQLLTFPAASSGGVFSLDLTPFIPAASTGLADRAVYYAAFDNGTTAPISITLTSFYFASAPGVPGAASNN